MQKVKGNESKTHLTLFISHILYILTLPTLAKENKKTSRILLYIMTRENVAFYQFQNSERY